MSSSMQGDAFKMFLNKRDSHWTNSRWCPHFPSGNICWLCCFWYFTHTWVMDSSRERLDLKGFLSSWQCPTNKYQWNKIHLSLYLAHFTTGPLYLFYILALVTFPVAVAKSGIALLQVIQMLAFLPQKKISLLKILEYHKLNVVLQ